MSQVSYGTITITDTTDLTTYIRYAKKSPLTEVADFQETPTTDTHFIAVLSIPSSDTIPAWNSADWKWSEFIGTDGLSVKSTRILYYLKTNSTNVPQVDKNTSIVSTDTQNAWISKNPTYVANGTYWTCLEVTLSDDTTKSWSAPTEDLGLTQAAKDAQGAMAQAASNVNSVTRLWYLTDTASVPTKPDTHVTETSTSVTGKWTRNKPTKDNYRYYYYCDEICTGGGVYSWTDVVADTLSLTSFELGLINAKIKNHWWDSNGLHFASGINNAAVTTTNANTYGYIGTLGLNGLTLGYNSYKAMELLTNVLNFYQPPIIGSTTEQGNKTMALTGNALRFYNPSDGITEQAILDANGLKLLKGGVESGDLAFGNGYVYLSTEDKTGIEINEHNPKDEDPKWRQIIGSKFGIDSEGNLYAASANIKGTINVNDELNSNIYTKEEVNSGLDNAAATATNFIKTSIDGSGIQVAAQNTSAYLLITDKVLRFYLNGNAMSQFGYDEIFESYGVQAENIFIKGAGNALRLDNNVNGTYQGQYILETRANGHLSLKPGLRRTEEE